MYSLQSHHKSNLQPLELSWVFESDRHNKPCEWKVSKHTREEAKKKNWRDELQNEVWSLCGKIKQFAIKDEAWE